ncbi:MAG: hypothetical protein Kow0022_05080 [Phycisphaerales bacterium]
MSQKWQRSRKWDDEHIPSWAFGVKFLLRAFSSITLAVVLLVFIAVYATLASVPVGLLLLLPTYVFYALTLVIPLTLVWVVGIGVVSRLAKSRGSRFAISLVGMILSGLVCVWLWSQLAWPALRYDPISGSGVRFFASSVEQYKSTTLRRLPWFEMTELEFYSWWPMRYALIAFVLNMFVATIRRIEFNFRNIGVLCVHTGIIVIALGSLYYQKLKKEGNTMLLAGVDPASGIQGIGPPQGAFFDNTRVVLDVRQDKSQMGSAPWEQRPLRGLPRYNDYGLDAGLESGVQTLGRGVGSGSPGRRLSIEAPPTSDMIDKDLRFRVVGYASYATLETDWVRVPPELASGALQPLRVISIFPSVNVDRWSTEEPLASFAILPGVPAGRVREGPQFAIEYTLSMDATRWMDLCTQLESRTSHALIIELPGDKPARVVTPVEEGSRVAVGDSGYVVEVEQLSPTPPMPIITRGYENATSSVAIVRITKPDGSGYQRWVYSRFPELNQDLLDATGATGRPIRRNADSEIRVAYIDASKTQVNLDEQPDGRLRVVVREPGGAVRVEELDDPAARVGGIDRRFDLAVTDRWEHAEAVERPVPVPEDQRDKQQVGTHAQAAIAVEVSVEGSDFSRVVWVPFTQYMGVGGEDTRTVRLPDGRRVEMAFARLQHPFPGFQVQLVDFEMIAYDHRGAPRDYQSTLRVSPKPSAERQLDFKPYTHVCKLNAPLRAPFHWDESAGWFSNVARRLFAGLNPNQYKLSQAGWDQSGWRQSQQLVDQGALERPFVRFTILGVGNNPGIHIIAFGSVLMAIGIPWAFYIKPWLVQREKARIQRSLAARSRVQADESIAESVR